MDTETTTSTAAATEPAARRSGRALWRVRPVRVVARRLGAAMTCALLLSAALLAGVAGIADLAAGNARVLLSAVAAHTHRPDLQAWNDAVDGLQLARRLQPWNADHAADLGRLYEWQSWQQIDRPAAAQAYRQAARVNYREALALRPGWGFVWAQLAHVSAMADGFGAESAHALARACTLAPWERGAQRTVIWMGLSRWMALDEPSRECVRDMVYRAWRIENHRGLIQSLARQFHWRDELKRIRRRLATYEGST